MKITVEFLSLPNVARMIGSKTITVDFSGQTVKELVHELCATYGERVRQFLLDEAGELDMHLTAAVNKQYWLRRDQMDRPLRDGDLVTIMLLAAGG